MTRKPQFHRADAACIDDDEGRISIVVDTDEGDKLYVDIHSVALDFYASVQANLRPYALEAEHARATMPQAGELDEAWPEPVSASVDMDLVRDLERGK